MNSTNRCAARMGHGRTVWPRLTDGQLEYIGEWHSHPDGIACLPSEDDLLVFSWLTQHMADAGLPALMAIAGQDRVAAWYLGQMVQAGGWQVGNRR